MEYQSKDRRPIPAREAQLSQRVAKFLANSGISANTISILSVVCGVGAGLSFVMTANSITPRLWWALAAIFIMLRLTANMLDGMVAIEKSETSAVGELFNEVPDRISDVVTFIGTGFALYSSPHLGYVAAILSLFIAYVRAMGNHMNVIGLFMGPMNKQQRMFSLIAACTYYLVAPATWQAIPVIIWILWAVNLGAILTIVRRLGYITARVKS
jgi:phosphatidylglycerophosphate synthase